MTQLGSSSWQLLAKPWTAELLLLSTVLSLATVIDTVLAFLLLNSKRSATKMHNRERQNTHSGWGTISEGKVYSPSASHVPGPCMFSGFRYALETLQMSGMILISREVPYVVHSQVIRFFIVPDWMQ